MCKGNGQADLIFVTGYFGAPIVETAEEIAEKEGMELLILDRAIEEKDGRPIRRICMMGGEHAYRNLEYEAVAELCAAADEGEADRHAGGLVVACGDGILYDDQTRDLILKHRLIIAGEDESVDDLWARACRDAETWHAFMHFGSDEERLVRFKSNHAAQKSFFLQDVLR